jgi:hypothetical protein
LWRQVDDLIATGGTLKAGINLISEWCADVSAADWLGSKHMCVWGPWVVLVWASSAVHRRLGGACTCTLLPRALQHFLQRRWAARWWRPRA